MLSVFLIVYEYHYLFVFNCLFFLMPWVGLCSVIMEFPCLEVIKHFSCATLISTKLKLPMSGRMVKLKIVLALKLSDAVFIFLIKV